ncbi:MAG: hypothetical protein OEZ68_14745 [Gammaproteobacteria bacterium]|nr:hypothetical protein [Gammaproteobacteria bacterium]MDH5802062.1 hypothetical protein [Gammaproteobacteria bacterium]
MQVRTIYRYALIVFLSIALLLGCGQEQNLELLGNFRLDVPIAYVKRPLDDIDNGQDPFNAIRYKPGGHLFIREFAANDSREFNVTANIPFYPNDPNPNRVNLLAPVMNGNNVVRQAGDVATPDVSFDGKRIVFAAKEGDYTNPPPTGQPKWDLWEYVIPEDGGIEDGTLQRLISLDTVAIRGNDFDPAYLPDGRVVFSSDRVSGKSDVVLVLEGISVDTTPLITERVNEPTANLHILNPRDQALEQISFNNSHELNPSVLSDGRIVYSRWEQFRGQNFDLFVVNPDGTGNNILYGGHSHDPAVSDDVFLNAKQTQNGQLVANIMNVQDTFSGGDLIRIDYVNFADIDQPRDNSTSDETAGQISLTGNQVTRGSGYSRRGRYTTPFPLWDNTNRLLVSWAPCESEDVNGNRRPCALRGVDLSDPDFAAPPAYGVWIFDANTGAQRNIVLPEAGMTITDPVALVDRVTLGNYPETVADQVSSEVLDNNMGLIKIRSVYDTSNLALVGNGALMGDERLLCNTASCGAAGAQVDIPAMLALNLPQRPAVRFARIVRAPIIVANQGTVRNMREISGYQQVEADGSVVMRVPANWPFAIELTDIYGRKFRSHNNWLQVKAGKTVECVGCHENHSKAAPMYLGTTGAVPNADMNAPVPVAQTLAETLHQWNILYADLDQGLAFKDYWRDPMGTELPSTDTTSLNYQVSYATLTTAAPVDINNCISNVCRTIIDYETHIQPLWERDRDPDPVLISACVTCHAEQDALMAAQVPAGQLTLTRGGSTASIEVDGETGFASYYELLDDDFVRVVVGTALVRLTSPNTVNGVTTLDPVPLVDNSDPIADPIANGGDGTVDRDRHIRPSNNSRLDGPFFAKMTSGAGTVDHSMMLEPIEMLLIQEWVDQGARYSNIP